MFLPTTPLPQHAIAGSSSLQVASPSIKASRIKLPTQPVAPQPRQQQPTQLPTSQLSSSQQLALPARPGAKAPAPRPAISNGKVSFLGHGGGGATVLSPAFPFSAPAPGGTATPTSVGIGSATPLLVTVVNGSPCIRAVAGPAALLDCSPHSILVTGGGGARGDLTLGGNDEAGGGVRNGVRIVCLPAGSRKRPAATTGSSNSFADGVTLTPVATAMAPATNVVSAALKVGFGDGDDDLDLPRLRGVPFGNTGPLLAAEASSSSATQAVVPLIPNPLQLQVKVNPPVGAAPPVVSFSVPKVVPNLHHHLDSLLTPAASPEDDSLEPWIQTV